MDLGYIDFEVMDVEMGLLFLLWMVLFVGLIGFMFFVYFFVIMFMVDSCLMVVFGNVVMDILECFLLLKGDEKKILCYF